MVPHGNLIIVAHGFLTLDMGTTKLGLEVLQSYFAVAFIVIWLCTFGESLAAVAAPFSSRICTASTSAALMAKNNTGIGTLDALGQAPRFRSKRMVASILTCLCKNSQIQWEIEVNTIVAFASARPFS